MIRLFVRIARDAIFRVTRIAPVVRQCSRRSMGAALEAAAASCPRCRRWRCAVSSPYRRGCGERSGEPDRWGVSRGSAPAGAGNGHNVPVLDILPTHFQKKEKRQPAGRPICGDYPPCPDGSSIELLQTDSHTLAPLLNRSGDAGRTGPSLHSIAVGLLRGGDKPRRLAPSSRERLNATRAGVRAFIIAARRAAGVILQAIFFLIFMARNFDITLM